MALALIASLLVAAPSSGAAANAVRSDDPPVKVWLNQDNYFVQGDKARVNVKVAEDGYLVVLRADADGRVRVLFPLDPGDDAFVRGGRKIEVRGRGDREAFYVDDREGKGVVLAARSVAPFKFDELVRGDHWDYRVLSARQAADDPEAVLLDVVQRMAPEGHFDYDVVSYTVASPSTYSGRDRHYYSSIGFGYGYGWPYRRFGFAYNSCFDPFFYDPFLCGSTYYDPFFYNPYFYGSNPYFYGGYRYRPFIFIGGVAIYNRPRYGGGLFIDRARRGVRGGLTFKESFAGAPFVMGVGPRLRVPQGTLLNRTVPSRVVPVSAAAPNPVRVRDPWAYRSAPSARARGEPIGRRAPEASRPERRDNGRGQDRSAAPRRERPSSGGGGWGGGGGGNRGGGGGGSASSGRGSSGSSGGSRGSAPSNGGGRRRP